MNTHIAQSESASTGSFIKMNKKLLNNNRYKSLSAQAKLLYAMLCDRKSLSEVNGWYDENGQVYIYYSLDAVSEDLGCCLESACKFMKELEVNALIRKQRQGQGKPNRIYVEDIIFDTPTDITISDNDVAEDKANANGVAESDAITVDLKNDKATNDDIKDFEETEIKTSEISKSGFRKNRNQEFGKTESNKTEYNKTELSKTEINNTYSEAVCDVMNYLNEKANKNYMLNSKNSAFILNRLNEGYALEDFIHVIDVKYEEWYGTDKEKYLRPSTLFKEDNFDNYVNQRSAPKKQTKGKTRLENEHDYDVALLERALFGE